MNFFSRVLVHHCVLERKDTFFNTEITLATNEFGEDDVIVERDGWQCHLCHCNCRNASALVQFEALTTSGLYSGTWSSS